MDIDFGQLIGLVTKSGPAGVVLALLLGLAALIREIRGGKVSAGKEADMTAEISKLKADMVTMQTAMKDVERRLDEALDLIHDYRYQRDQARIRVEYLEQTHGVTPRTTWPPEPDAKGLNT